MGKTVEKYSSPNIIFYIFRRKDNPAIMVRRKATSQSLSVPVLLNEAQRASASGHLRYARVMWDLQVENAAETLQQIMFGVKLFMTVPEVGSFDNRRC